MSNEGDKEPDWDIGRRTGQNMQAERQGRRKSSQIMQPDKVVIQNRQAFDRQEDRQNRRLIFVMERRTDMEPFHYQDLEALGTNLPDDILSRKMAGDFDGERRLIDLWLGRDISEALRGKLRVEREISRFLEADYPYTYEQALEKARGVLPGLTEAQFARLQDEGRIDWIYVHGKEHFISSTAGTLRNDLAHAKTRRLLEEIGAVPPAEKNGSGAASAQGTSGNPEPEKESTWLCSLRDMHEKGKDSWTFRIRFTLKIEDSAFRPGHVKVYLPVVCACDYVSNIRILGTSSEHYVLAREDAPQRTILFEENMTENHPFFVEYEFTSTPVYHDLWSETAKEENRKASAALGAAGDDAQRCGGIGVLRPDGPLPEGVRPEDLTEQLPHIAFTPFMRSLAEKLTGQLETPLEKAQAIYDYITEEVTYSYVRSYFAIENQGEYCALNRKGDCGLQALMFITLARIVGIPAKWQSGNEFDDCPPGCHDWAQMYLAPWGWLYCDPSYGGGAFRSGREERRRHYLGNLDPFRIPSNPAFQKQFEPPMVYLRHDPYDNQSGEVEYDDGSLTEAEYDTEKKLVSSVHLG